MRFWDSSAVVPLLVLEPSTPSVLGEYEIDPESLVWWSTPVECASAISRLEREGALSAADATAALERLHRLAASWRIVQPLERIRVVALRLLRVHPLRAADALQLAAAHLGAEDHPASLPFLTLDDRLALAAQREGFPVVRPDRG